MGNETNLNQLEFRNQAERANKILRVFFLFALGISFFGALSFGHEKSADFLDSPNLILLKD